MNCNTNEIHEIECPMNKTDFTMVNNLCTSYLAQTPPCLIVCRATSAGLGSDTEDRPSRWLNKGQRQIDRDNNLTIFISSIITRKYAW